MTGLKAYTNEQGYHQRERWVLDTFRDTPDSGAWYSYNRDNWRVCQAFENSNKMPSIQGNHKSAYNYYREVGRVLIDEPRVARYRERATVGSRPVLWDYVETKHWSPERGLLWWMPLAAADRENALNKSYVQAMNALGGAKAQLGADLAEARQTLGMIADLTIDLAKAINAARVGNWGNVPKHLKMLKKDILTGKYAANKWLEYQYGWAPLVGSLYDLSNAFIQGLREKDLNLAGKGFGRWEGIKEVYDWGDTHEEGNSNGRCKTVVLATVDRASIHGLDRLGLINPASIAWELVPFSFVIDWFVPIGAVLETYTATLGLIPQGGYTSEHTYSLVDITSQPNQWGDPDGTFYRVTDLGHYRHAGYGFRRTARTTWPDVGLYANVKPFSSLTRCGNALALLRQIQK